MNNNCEGCDLSHGDYLCYTKFNQDESCPCSLCLVKMMVCNPSKSSMNHSCDKWMDWFGEKRFEYSGMSRADYEKLINKGG